MPLNQAQLIAVSILEEDFHPGFLVSLSSYSMRRLGTKGVGDLKQSAGVFTSDFQKNKSIIAGILFTFVGDEERLPAFHRHHVEDALPSLASYECLG